MWAPAALLALAVLTGAWAWWLIAWPVVRLANVADHAGHFALVLLHTAGGTLMLAIGAAALYVGWTRRAFRYHRILGYAYLGGGAVGAVLALVLALADTHGDTAVPFRIDLGAASDVGIALAALAVAWLGAAAMALRAARNRRFEVHRAWMVRSYVLTWSFVLCRLAGRVPALGELGDGAAVVWLSWVGPLLVCEVVLQWRETGRKLAPRAGNAERVGPDRLRPARLAEATGSEVTGA